jgi:hypothetical protein
MGKKTGSRPGRIWGVWTFFFQCRDIAGVGAEEGVVRDVLVLFGRNL